MENFCARCGVKYVWSTGVSATGTQPAPALDQYQKTFIKLYYKDNLCPECMQHVRDSFYAFDVAPEFRKAK